MAAPRQDVGRRPSGAPLRNEVLEHAFARERGRRATLWVEEPRGRRRMPDPVRRSAVRAVLIIAVTVIEVNVAVLCALAESWAAAPMTLAAVVSTILATWSVLDVWITRQVHAQRHGVVSNPSSAARPARAKRIRTRQVRQDRAAGSPSASTPHLSGV